MYRSDHNLPRSFTMLTGCLTSHACIAYTYRAAGTILPGPPPLDQPALIVTRGEALAHSPYPAPYHHLLVNRHPAVPSCRPPSSTLPLIAPAWSAAQLILNGPPHLACTPAVSPSLVPSISHPCPPCTLHTGTPPHHSCYAVPAPHARCPVLPVPITHASVLLPPSCVPPSCT
jgi:hypothetical protein